MPTVVVDDIDAFTLMFICCNVPPLGVLKFITKSIIRST